ncbi:hypothetical protein BH20ACI3_BH20ACI3_33190 [soil metagenome]
MYSGYSGDPVRGLCSITVDRGESTQGCNRRNLQKEMKSPKFQIHSINYLRIFTIDQVVDHIFVEVKYEQNQ